MDQVAVRAVHLDAVETGLDGQPGRLDVLLDDPGDLVDLEGAGHRVRLAALGGDHLVRGRERARRDRLDAVLVVGVRDPAGVHQLHDDAAAARVDRVRDPAPALDLLGGVQAGGVQVALARALGWVPSVTISAADARWA